MQHRIERALDVMALAAVFLVEIFVIDVEMLARTKLAGHGNGM